MEQQTGFKEVFLRLVAIVGLIAVLILGAWGIILLAFNLVGLFTGSVQFSSLFNNDNGTEQVATTTVPVVVVDNTDTTSKPATTVTKPTTTTSKPSAVYTPAAKPAATLYGLPDLAVTIQSITSLSSVQGRTVVKFTVSNVGTNTARSGWTFNASLPLNPVYTYQSGAQQALNPGDSIAYTLTYDNQNYNQACTQQYPYNCNYNQYNQYPYYNTQPQTCYTYNGYQNVAGPCPVTYDQNGNAIYSNTNQYNYDYNNQYNPNYNYYNNGNSNTGYYPYAGTVTINLDPQNYILESSEYNNTASKSTY